MKQKLISIPFILSILNGQTGIISGFVTDSSSGESLIGANVFLQENGQGMATDINGYYIIQEIIPGNYTIMVSYIGFDVSRQPLSIMEDQSQVITFVDRKSTRLNSSHT